MSRKPSTSQAVQIKRWHHDSGYIDELDFLAEECPVALVYNGVSHAVMMMTPSDMEQFAIGFSLTEGIVDRAGQIFGIDVTAVDVGSVRGFEITVEIASGAAWKLGQKRRALAGRTGCGLCGVDSIEQAIRPIDKVQPGAVISPRIIDIAASRLQAHQPLQNRTGAVHAAAWFTPEGELRQIYEDVGRHNALDKLVGYIAQHDIDPRAGFVLMSSRGSYEIVHKAVAAGISNVATISAPTALAARLADEAGVRLIGFARPGKHSNYS